MVFRLADKDAEKAERIMDMDLDTVMRYWYEKQVIELNELISNIESLPPL